MPGASKEQQYEIGLTGNIVFNVVFALVVIVIFPLLKRICPAVFAPQSHLPRKNNGLMGYIFWFIDVFKQPLSVFATRGNLATMFAIFCTMMLGQMFFQALVSLTILIPVYFYGTDQSWTTNYLTFWQKTTISHLEKNSVMNLVPIFITVYFTVATMIFYKQFTLIFVFFRQRTMRRQIPQNYVVMVQNLPKVINLKSEVETLLKDMKAGVRAIIPVPAQSDKLTSLYEKLSGAEKTLLSAKINMQDLNANALYQKAMATALQKESAKQRDEKKKLEAEKALKTYQKLKEKAEKELKKFSKTIQAIRDFKLQILDIVRQDDIDIEYMYKVKSYPPDNLSLVEHSFDIFPQRAQEPLKTRFQSCKYVRNLSKQIENNMAKQNLGKKPRAKPQSAEGEVVGTSFFMLCESQAVTAEKYTALISQNEIQPEAILAPNPREIMWKHIAKTNQTKLIRRIFYWVILLGIFAAYLYGQTLLMGVFARNETAWTRNFFSSISRNNCPLDVQQSGLCSLAESVASMLITMLPSLSFATLMGLLPQFLKLTIRLLGYPSQARNQDLLYNLIFVFLILIQGVIQIALPNMIDVAQGEFNINVLSQLTIKGFIESLGRNIVTTQFQQLTYLLNKYFLFPIYSLINFYGLTMFLFALAEPNKLNFNKTLRTLTLNWPKETAYMSHMIVLSFTFAISAPVTNVIICIIFFMFAAIDRYFILYIVTPTMESDLSSQANMMLNVISTNFIGLIFMLVGTACYFLVQGDQVYIFGIVVCILCLVGALYYKANVDHEYKRGLRELARGRYFETESLKINPAHPYNDYDENTRYTTCYNKEDPEYRRTMVRKFKSVERSKSIFDGLLKAFYIDLTKIPVSLIRSDSQDNTEKTVTLLDDGSMENLVIPGDPSSFVKEVTTKSVKKALSKMRNVASRSEQRDVGPQDTVVTDQMRETLHRDYSQEEVDIMSQYTHPAIVAITRGMKNE